MADLVVNLKVNDDGSVQLRKFADEAKKVENATNNTTTSSKNFASSLMSLKSVMGALAVGVVVKEFINLSDTFTGMQSKLKLVTSSTNELATAQSELFKIAQATRQGYAETADVFSNFAVAMGDMGKSQKEILRVTETVNKAIAISGGTAQQAAAATMQLGQAFASGTLRGDELNSILENSKGLAQAIADGMGVPIGKLRELGSEGKITAETLANALDKSAKSVDEKFGKVGATVGQSMTVMNNALLNAVGEMDKAVGASSALSSTIMSLSEVFTSAANSIHNFNIEIVRLQDVRKIKTFDDANTALKQIDDEIKSLTTSTDLSDRIKRNLMGEVNLRAKLIQLRASEAALNKKVNVIANEEVKIQEQRANAYKNQTISSGNTPKSSTGKTKTEKEWYPDVPEMTKAFDLYDAMNTARHEKETAYVKAETEDQADKWASYTQSVEKATIETTTFWDDMFVNINKAMESNFFDAMTGRFQSFGSWLKDFWKSITSSLASGLSKTLADYMMGGLKGGIQNSFASFGGLSGALGSIGTPSYLSGATTDSAGFTTTAGGTVMDAAGQITKEGSDIASIVSNISTLKALAVGGLYAPSAYIGQLAGTVYGAGFTGTGSFLGGVSNAFAGGSASGLSGAAFAGNVLGAGVLGGLGGYALGSIGDKLLGADTKAGSYGAIGGAAGAMIGSVVPVVGTIIGGIIGAALGSVIGGMFGSTKATGSGIQSWGDISSESVAGNVQSYTDFKNKSWFKSRSWTEYYGLDDKTIKQIEGVFTTYDYLLGQLGDFDKIIVGAGKYSGSSFFSAIDKAFIRAFIDNPTLTDTFYNAWTDYASQIGKGVQETFASLVSGYVDYTRSFQTWALESGGNSLESMRLQAEWAQKDLQAIQSLYGVSGVTVENYLDMYQQAIKESFTPETITQWQTLGDALMKATDANEKYKDSLAGSTSLIPNDMMLSRTGVLTEALSISQMVDNQSTQTQQTATMVAQLYEVVKVLKQQLTIAQFGSTSGVPA